MNQPVIVMAKRTAVGKVGGMLKNIPPEKLVSPLINTIIEQGQICPTEIDDVILGNTVGPGGNLARLSALEAGLPVSVPGVTVDRQCGSGLEAINQAARLIQAGAGDIYLAGGVESTSLAPWKIEKPSSLYQPGGPHIFKRARFSPEAIGDPEMGVAAENVARKYDVTRDQQDRYALNSHEKAVAAQRNGWFDEEIVSIHGAEKDECPRPTTTFEKLSALPPIFVENGTVTAGNACPINDGAALVLVMSEQKCREYGLTPVLRFVDATAAGVDPNYLGIGPVPAVQKLLKRQSLSVAEIEIVEFNEAFASQVIASLNEIGLKQEMVNCSGGALALGHPYGASGAILVTRLFTEMKRKQLKKGLATLGIGGGLGLATLFEGI
ncbi:thiolase family protein [Bacillus tianshenii]|nr:thiolase family protein [Bacillus tianshenii]